MQAGFEVVIRPPGVEEMTGGIPAHALVLANAELKALAVASQIQGDLVLGADTVVVLDGEIMGKPRDLSHAVEMLGQLAGKTHEVLTGVCLIRGGSVTRCSFVESTRVVFRPLSKADIKAYLDDIDPLDKAGSYAAQEDKGRLIEQIEGSLANVIGLPIARVLAAIETHFAESPQG